MGRNVYSFKIGWLGKFIAHSKLMYLNEKKMTSNQQRKDINGNQSLIYQTIQIIYINIEFSQDKNVR